MNEARAGSREQVQLAKNNVTNEFTVENKKTPQRFPPGPFQPPTGNILRIRAASRQAAIDVNRRSMVTIYRCAEIYPRSNRLNPKPAIRRERHLSRASFAWPRKKNRKTGRRILWVPSG